MKKKVQINNAQSVYLLDLYLEVFLIADFWRCLLNCQCFLLFLSIGTCSLSECGISGDTKEAVALFCQQTNTQYSQIFYRQTYKHSETHTQSQHNWPKVCNWVLALPMVCRCSGCILLFLLIFSTEMKKKSSSRTEVSLFAKKLLDEQVFFHLGRNNKKTTR